MYVALDMSKTCESDIWRNVSHSGIVIIAYISEKKMRKIQ